MNHILVLFVGSQKVVVYKVLKALYSNVAWNGQHHLHVHAIKYDIHYLPYLEEADIIVASWKF